MTRPLGLASESDVASKVGVLLQSSFEAPFSGLFGKVVIVLPGL